MAKFSPKIMKCAKFLMHVQQFQGDSNFKTSQGSVLQPTVLTKGQPLATFASSETDDRRWNLVVNQSAEGAAQVSGKVCLGRNTRWHEVELSLSIRNVHSFLPFHHAICNAYCLYDIRLTFLRLNIFCNSFK